MCVWGGQLLASKARAGKVGGPEAREVELAGRVIEMLEVGLARML